ncbi:glutaredoxin family protein [Oceanobacillus alkalisoli]|uniref:glutaredoxin family protein n=1 Tax=Oceanobacillus alkalisoli TaxID=2925113 RepID=UPI001EEFFDB9|nr:glutaredoxin domain-containing protein [Oceanobacillus alkalisoli]MCF3944633.1 glutaredoxin family protein [Oceanobacillus alkalisoli]MCG5104819.1 glutaredoxin family protein [Oceanobacillus alkalisoli]
MDNHDVIIYVSDNNHYCTQVIDLVKKYDVTYKIKNVTQDRDYMKEMQDIGIYGTPAMFVKGEKHSILGYQKERIRHALSKVEH